MKKNLLTILSVCFISAAIAQVPVVDINTLGNGGSYYQTFDTLSSSGSTVWHDATSPAYTLPGWYAVSTNLTNYISNAGSTSTGSLYSFGAVGSTDRALGSVASGTSGTLSYDVLLKNNTGQTVTAVRISYMGEQWRSANVTVVNTLSFGYKTGTGLSGVDTGFTANTTFDFASPNLSNALAINGNAAANRAQITNLLSVTLNPGDELFIHWQDLNDTGNDQGMGLDSLVVTFHNASTLPVELLTIKAEASKNNSNDIIWTTAQEINNSHFDVERSFNGKDFTTIGVVKGNGTYNGYLNYTFSDNDPVIGQTNYYRLKQVDFDGQYTYSKTVSVTPTKEILVSETAVFPNPLNEQSKLVYNMQQPALVTATMYDIVGQPVARLINEFQAKGFHAVPIPEMPNAGVYFIKISSENTTKTIRVIAK